MVHDCRLVSFSCSLRTFDRIRREIGGIMISTPLTYRIPYTLLATGGKHRVTGRRISSEARLRQILFLPSGEVLADHRLPDVEVALQ